MASPGDTSNFERGILSRGLSKVQSLVGLDKAFAELEQNFTDLKTEIDSAYKSGSTIHDNLSWMLAGVFEGTASSVSFSKENAAELAKVYASVFPSPYTLTNISPFLSGFSDGFSKTSVKLGELLGEVYVEGFDKQILKMDSAVRDASKALNDPSNRKKFYALGLKIGIQQGDTLQKSVDKGKDEVVRQMGALVGSEILAELFGLGLTSALSKSFQQIKNIGRFSNVLDDIPDSGRPTDLDRGIEVVDEPSPQISSTEQPVAPKVDANPTAPKSSIDSFLTEDRSGFLDPDIEALYQQYKKRKLKNAQDPANPLDWMKLTRGRNRAALKRKLGDDFPVNSKTKKQKGRSRNVSDYPAPPGYTRKMLVDDLEVLLKNHDLLYERVKRLAPDGDLESLLSRPLDKSKNQFSLNEFFLLKGNLAEVMSLPIQFARLSEIRKLNGFENAELITGLRVRRMKDGKIRGKVQFSDNIIAAIQPDGSMMLVGVRFEVKSGGFSSSKIQDQIFTWDELRIEDGLQLVVDKGSKRYSDANTFSVVDEPISFTYKPAPNTESAPVIGMISGNKDLIIPKGENFPNSTGDDIAAAVRRLHLDRSTDELNYIAAQLLSISPKSTAPIKTKPNQTRSKSSSVDQSKDHLDVIDDEIYLMDQELLRIKKKFEESPNGDRHSTKAKKGEESPEDVIRQLKKKMADTDPFIEDLRKQFSDDERGISSRSLDTVEVRSR